MDYSQDDYEDYDNDEKSIEGEVEEAIQYTTKQSNEGDEDIEKDRETNNMSEVTHDTVTSDGTNKKPADDKEDVDTVHNEKPDNSDDIIPTENAEPVEESASVKVSQIQIVEMPKGNNSTNTENMQSSPIESRDISKAKIKDDGNKTTMKWRLGIGGPAFTKRQLQVNIQDISTDSDKGAKTPHTKELKGGNKSVMRKLMCTKCPDMFFTMEGYQRHLFKDHKIRCFEKYPPQVIEKVIIRHSQETYQTNYRVVTSKDSDKDDGEMKESDKVSKKTDMAEDGKVQRIVNTNDNVQTKHDEETKIDENNENIEQTDVSKQGTSKNPRRGRKCKGRKSHLTSRKKKSMTDKGNEEECDTSTDKGTKEESDAYKKLRLAIWKVYEVKKEQPKVKCIGCDIHFYTDEGMRTHFQHAHTNMKGIVTSENKETEKSAPLTDVSSVANVAFPEESELPDIIEPTQPLTHGRK